MHRLLGGALHREYRGGDVQFAGLDDFEEPEHEDPVGSTPRYRQVVRDVIDTLYF